MTLGPFSSDPRMWLPVRMWAPVCHRMGQGRSVPLRPHPCILHQLCASSPVCRDFLCGAAAGPFMGAGWQADSVVIEKLHEIWLGLDCSAVIKNRPAATGMERIQSEHTQSGWQGELCGWGSPGSQRAPRPSALEDAFILKRPRRLG